MRLGVLDVGSNTVHFLVVDAYRGARPTPVYSHKAELRLGDHLEDGSRLSDQGATQLHAFVLEALQIAEDKGVEELLAFATSAVREAANADEVLARIRDETGAHVQVLSGRDEARLTFLAARRWFGWSSGKLLIVDIGGGSLEVAEGVDEEPDVAISRRWAGCAATGSPATRPAPRKCASCAGMSGPRSAACRRGDARRPAGPGGGHVQDVPPAGPDRRGRAVQRGVLRPPAAQPRPT